MKRRRKLFSTAAGVALCVTAASTFVSVSPAPAPLQPHQPQDQAPAAHGSAPVRLPIRFEPNVGQFAAGTHFVARSPGQVVSLLDGEAVVSLRGPGVPSSGPAAGAGAASRPRPAPIRLRFATGEPSAAVEALEPVAGVTNYIGGTDPAGWHTGVPGYARVAYRGVWPGVDVVFHGDRGRLEYDFVVAPGSDPAPIEVAVDGAGPLSVDGAGNLVMATAGGPLRQPPPTIYQDAGGRRELVTGSYRIQGDHHFRFDLGPYDTALPLVIDPEVVYATYLGGNGSDYAYAVAVGSGGEAYVAGLTESADFPPNQAQPDPTGDPGDAFVARVSADGKALVYATYVGGENRDLASAIAVDRASGATYVTGATSSRGFPRTANALLVPTACQPSPPPLCTQPQPFLVRLDAGGALTYGTYLAPDQDRPSQPQLGQGKGVAFGPDGRAYVVGLSESIRGFLTVLDPARDPADQIVFSSEFTGSDGQGVANAVAVGPGGLGYVTGYTDSPNFTTTPGAYDDGKVHTDSDAFLAVFDPDPLASSSLVYSARLGGTGHETANGIALNGTTGQVYIAGATPAIDFPITLGAFQPASRSVFFPDAFLTVLDTSPAQTDDLVYSTYLGGSSSDRANAVAVGSGGRAYLTGATTSEDFLQVGSPNPRQEDKPWVVEIDPAGQGPSDLVSLAQYTFGEGQAVAADVPSATFFVAGYAPGGIPTTDGVHQQQPARFYDGFLIRFRSTPPPCPGSSTTIPDITVPGAGGTAAGAGGGHFGTESALSASRPAAVGRRRRGGRRRRTSPAPAERSPAPRQRGFTLIELLVVIVILGILSAVVVFAVRGTGDKGDAAARATDVRILRTAQEAFCATFGRYAESDAQLVNGGFLSQESEHHEVKAEEGDGFPCNGWRYFIETDPGSTTTTLPRNCP